MNVWVSFEPLWREIVFPLALIVILIHHLFRLFYIDTLSTSSHSSWCMYEHECLLTYRSCKHLSNNSQLMKIYFCISCHLISAPRSVSTPYVSVYDVQLEALHKKTCLHLSASNDTYGGFHISSPKVWLILEFSFCRADIM